MAGDPRDGDIEVIFDGHFQHAALSETDFSWLMLSK
jgi:hypothetical protein